MNKWSVMVTFIDGTPIYTVYRKAPTPQDAHWKEYAPNGSFYDIKEAQEYAEKLNCEEEREFLESLHKMYEVQTNYNPPQR